jgi:hypothetical protein
MSQPCVKAAVRQNGYILEYTSLELKADKEIVLAAVMQNGLALALVEVSTSRKSF